MYKYVLLFNGRSAEFTDLHIALHVAYLLAEAFDVDMVEYTDDSINGITSIKRSDKKC